MQLHSQALIEVWLQRIWIAIAVMSVLVAYALEDQSFAWFTLLFTSLLSSMLIVPDWPFWNKNPLQWRGVSKAPVMEESSKAD